MVVLGDISIMLFYIAVRGRSFGNVSDGVSKELLHRNEEIRNQETTESYSETNE